jgi:flagellar biosynthesis/type III secretory pathway protein FliH
MSENETVNDASCKDINDVFESLTFIEDNLASDGFKEGLEKGKTDGEIEGYHLGYHRGAEIGSEIGYYKGFLEALRKTLEVSSQQNIVVEKLEKLIESFPLINDEFTDLIAQRDGIRSTYKRLCSLLKLDPKIPENSELSF